ncbi:proteasome assembly chaperone 2 isoform X2 [Ananas comosus]|uniref:Proteasome assembly chaperone 2 n=1 Tax=Ananas comosus TaxID=4615 RepID=A0A6P5FAW2_ANACO|nr:proteasome assembly chaperone 2 isoform X2 [Ananas comosus]
MEFAPEDEGRSLSPECPTLLLPGLSIGNVGQLAVDLLIASTRAKRVGWLDAPSVLPCVGNDAYGPVAEGDLALPLEAYESPLHAISLIQQRSPVIKVVRWSHRNYLTGCAFIQGMMVTFAKKFANFLVRSGKQHVIVLSSLDSGRRKNIDASSGMQIYYISSVSDDGTDTDCENLGFEKLAEYNPSQRRWKYLTSLTEGATPQEDVISDEDELLEDDYYPGLPFAALFSCCKAKGLRVTCLLCYCSEGDNITDSFQLAAAACKLLGLNPDKFRGNEEGGWITPLSWTTVYGPPPDMSLF